MTSFNRKKTTSIPESSGFSILVHSRPAQILVRLWIRLNIFVRPILPLVHFLMVVVIGVILYAVVFANQHVPGCYDDICMVDPAFHRATTGVWHSIAQWDSIDVIPFAPNYPLLINILRLLIACFGFNYWILRGSMLVSGLVPVALLLWLFRRKGLLQSGREVLQAAYFAAGFTFFYWSVYVRPEAILLSVATLFVFAWGDNRPVLLFLAALLVPLCGLQWNVLLLPVALHWLVFGGRLRNPVLVAVAFVLSSVATIAAYHLLGMWPSYLQEAARVGGLDAFHSAISKMAGAWRVGDFYWLFFRLGVFVALSWLTFVFVGLLALRLDREVRPLIVFTALFPVICILAIALFGQLNSVYTYLLVLPLGLILPRLFRPLTVHHPLLLVLVALTCPLWTARAHWAHCRNTANPCQWMHLAHPDFSEARWLDEGAMEAALRPLLAPDELVLAPPDLYYAVHAVARELYTPDCAFDLSPAQRSAVTAVLMEAVPSDMEISALMRLRKQTGRPDLFAHLAPSPLPSDPEATFRVTPDDLLAAIADHWHCHFEEIPLPPPSSPTTIPYRLFRPVYR
jgi:hypothetical protein